MKIVILTGYSGAGKSTALRYIEEHGYYCVDNLPAQMLKDFISIVRKCDIEKVVAVIDARGRNFMRDLERQLTDLQKTHTVRIVFYESDLVSITKRFQEHRLRHPLALKGTIKQGFETEKKLLTALRQKADIIINTSGMNVHSLKSLIRKHVLSEPVQFTAIHLMSFGFKYGIPPEADLVFDVRTLINPFFEPELKSKTGKSPAVQKFISKDKHSADFIARTKSYLEYLLKCYAAKSKPFVTIAFGCTGGRHRSVFIVEKMKKILQAHHKKVKVYHRDMLLD